MIKCDRCLRVAPLVVKSDYVVEEGKFFVIGASGFEESLCTRHFSYVDTQKFQIISREAFLTLKLKEVL